MEILESVSDSMMDGCRLLSRKVVIRLLGKGDSNSHSARSGY